MPGQLDTLLEQLETLRTRAIGELERVETSADLEEWNTRYLGRKRGELTSLLSAVATLSKEDRRAVGQKANAVKTELEQRLAAKREALLQVELLRSLQQERIDVTLPGRKLPVGHIHPISRTIDEVTQVFVKMGFQVLQGSEVETDYFNFQSLNFPPDHPSRDMQDTFWIVPGQILLRTQTTSMQARIMAQARPPIRTIMPGKVYRNEAVDASHEAMFHQLDGLLVDEHSTMADLKGCLERLFHVIFGKGRRMRFRASYFPFTEPSAEADVDCPLCNGKGCQNCKYSGWIEVLGSGMVHPNVLREVGYDPNKYRGFAFGIGVESLTKARYALKDVHLLFGNDLRFLRQF
jgi:phenylalanyl-tRNA synthetase alpha chain